MRAVVLVGAALAAAVASAEHRSPPTADYDVLVYGSTPSGIMAAVASARHGASTALLSQRSHIGGVCSGGLGQTDIGGCANEVIGGLALEFFQRNARSYATPQPRAPWNLEPHVAKNVFMAMLNESGVALLPPAEVSAVQKQALRLTSIATEDGQNYSARVMIDASCSLR
jgi:flavin-dependent dehydrogenase